MKQRRHAFRVLYPVSGPDRCRAAALRLARSRKSLDWFLRRDRDGLQLFADARPGQMIAVFVDDGDEPIGIVGFRQGGRDAFVTEAAGFRRLYGAVGGTWRLSLYRLIGWSVAPSDAVYVSALWVDPAWRTRGAGLALLRAIADNLKHRIVVDLRQDNRRFRGVLEWWGMRETSPGWLKPLWKALGLVRLEIPARDDDVHGRPGYIKR